MKFSGVKKQTNSLILSAYILWALVIKALVLWALLWFFFDFTDDISSNIIDWFLIFVQQPFHFQVSIL